MQYHCRFAGVLTPAQSEVLKTLYELHKQMGDSHYWKPKDLGAFRSSHHAITLRRLTDRGFVEKKREEGQTGFSYKITAEGISAWDAYIETCKAPEHTTPDNESVRERWSVMTSLLSILH